MAKQEPMTLIQFQQKYQTEEACHQHLYHMKWPDGFRCPACEHEKAYDITTRRFPLYECARCKHQTTVTTGTIFEKTRTDLADELGLAYQTAWTIQHKIRKAMGDREDAYTLNGIVELDESFFGAPTEGGKRGRGTDKTPVLIALVIDKKGCPQYVKMQVIPDVKGSTLTEFAAQYIEAGSTIASDQYQSYSALGKEGYPQVVQPYNLADNPDHLKWLHTIVSNAKSFIGGTYHGLDPKHLQAYLNEFCYRFNRRGVKNQVFNRLVHGCLSTNTITYPELVHDG